MIIRKREFREQGPGPGPGEGPGTGTGIRGQAGNATGRNNQQLAIIISTYLSLFSSVLWKDECTI